MENLKKEWHDTWYNSDKNDNSGILYRVSAEGSDAFEEIFKWFTKRMVIDESKKLGKDFGVCIIHGYYEDKCGCEE